MQHPADATPRNCWLNRQNFKIRVLQQPLAKLDGLLRLLNFFSPEEAPKMESIRRFDIFSGHWGEHGVTWLESRSLDEIGRPAKRWKIAAHLAAVPFTEFPRHLVVDSKRSHKNQALDLSRVHRLDYGLRLTVDVFSRQVRVDDVLTCHHTAELFLVEDISLNNL